MSKKCPICYRKLVRKEVEKFLRGNGDTAILKVNAEVCLNCGAKIYAPRVMARFAEIKKKLKQGQTEDFMLVGKTYEVSS